MFKEDIRRNRHKDLNNLLENYNPDLTYLELNLQETSDKFKDDLFYLFSSKEYWVRNKFDYDNYDHVLFEIEQRIDNDEY